MLPLLLLAATPTLPEQARSVIEAQLRAPPRTDAGLSAQEAEVIRQHYLQSIGQRPPQRSEEDRSSQ